MKKKLDTYFEKARNIEAHPLIDEAEIRNRLGNKSKFSDKIIVPKIKGVSKMAFIASSITVLTVAFLLLFNPHASDNLKNDSDKKIITKERTYDRDEILNKAQSERNVLLDDTDDISKDQIPILRLTAEELEKLDVYLSDEGIEFMVESIWHPENLNDYIRKEDLNDKQYPKKMENKIIRTIQQTNHYEIKNSLKDFAKWDLSEPTGYFPICHKYSWKDREGKFGFGSTEFLQSPLIEKSSWSYLIKDINDLSRSYAPTILEIAPTRRKDGFDIKTSNYFDSWIRFNEKVIFQYIFAKDMIPIYINNKVKTGTEHHLLWYAPTEELIERLPERYQGMIGKRYDIIQDKYVVSDDVKKEYNERKKEFIDVLSKQNNSSKDDDFVPQRIAGIEKLELTWDELKKIGIRIEDSKLISTGQEWYFTKNKEKGYLDILRDKKYPINIDSGIFRIKSMIDTNSFELSHEKPLKYENWDMNNGAEILPVAITILYKKVGYADENGQICSFTSTTEYVEDKNPLLDKYADTDNLLYNGDQGFQSKLKLLIPVNIKLGEHDVKDSSKYKNTTINYWFFATEEFVELLPDRYKIPILNELKMISNVEDGSMSYGEACDALKGESYFGICTMESENIKNFRIFPNPSSDGKFKIDFDILIDCNMSFDVYSTDGQLLGNINGMPLLASNEASSKMEWRYLLELGDSYSDGVYLLCISTDKGDRIVAKIIIGK